MVTDEKKVRVSRVIQERGLFVVLPPKVYHGSFKTEYNVAKATNFADFSWPQICRLIAKNREMNCPIGQNTILVEMIV